MHLSPLGKLAQDCWQQIPQQTIKGVRLGAFVVMPNHLHGIIILDRAAEDEPLRVPRGTKPPKAGAIPPKSKPHQRAAYFKALAPKKGSLSYILRSFKGVVTHFARKAGLLEAEQPLWQARFYDRIVRNEEEEARLTDFIQQNVAQWDDYYLPPPPNQDQPDRPRPRPLCCRCKPYRKSSYFYKQKQRWPKYYWYLSHQRRRDKGY